MKRENLGFLQQQQGMGIESTLHTEAEKHSKELGGHGLRSRTRDSFSRRRVQPTSPPTFASSKSAIMSTLRLTVPSTRACPSSTTMAAPVVVVSGMSPNARQCRSQQAGW
ncbi:uncharacterized protein LOC131001150 [Salvia miltiorrhiza]|uniref:uncharacterized protein LOC131001133 n=1 Tax=Salvia miltiorrhiza TaxID=226208 RepID=UPI0025ACF2C7|nr:uncharacterized protein LOC131001133 [Salvia miltiorrhiza]XP_057783405.1 uncharacterized protein LOC131001150 [Salvia miltiorrhiza]